MPLRVRCPECKTVLDVPAGMRPTCPKCGFAGRSGKADPAPASAPPAQGVKFTRMSSAPPAAQAPQQAQAQWQEWQPEGQAAPASEPQVEWGSVEEEWSQPEQGAAWPAGQPAQEPPKRKGWFRKS